MDATHTTTLQLVVEMVANGRGHAVTKEHIKELQAEMDALNAKTQRSPTENLRLSNIQNLLSGLNGAEAGEKAAADVAKGVKKGGSEARKEGKKLGKDIGEEAGEEAGEKLAHHIKKHLANMAGKSADIGGLGGLFAAGGVAGIGAAVGLAAIEKTIEKTIEKMAELREEMRATGELVETLGSAQMFSAENLHKITEVAERMHSAKHSTSEWLGTLGELARVGADPETMGTLAEDTQKLAKLMGGDMVGATKMMSDALQGNTEDFKRVNMALAENLSTSERMAQIHGQLGLRVSEYGNAAVSAVPQLKQLAEAEKQAARNAEGVKESATRAASALTAMVAAAEKLKGDKTRLLDAQEQLAIDEEEKKVAENHESRVDADRKILEIRKRFAAERLRVEEEAVNEQKGMRLQAMADAQAGLQQNFENEQAARKRVEAAAAIEEAQGKIAEARSKGRRVDEFGTPAGAVSDDEAALLQRYKKALVLSDEDREAKKDLEARLKKYGRDSDVQAQVRAGEEELAALRRQSPDVGSRAAEQTNYNALRAKRAELDEPFIQAFEENTQAVRDLQESFERLKEIMATEAKDKAVQAQTKTAQDAEARNKQLEAEAKSYSKRAHEAREKGYPEPEMPRDLRGRAWEYDEFNDKFKWVKPQGGGAAAPPYLKQTASAIGDAAAGIDELVNQAVALKTAVAQAVSRMKNDGGRIG